MECGTNYSIKLLKMDFAMANQKICLKKIMFRKILKEPGTDWWEKHQLMALLTNHMKEIKKEIFTSQDILNKEPL